MRHRWTHKKKQSTCRHCGLVVKTYKVKKGGLPRCGIENALQEKKPNCNNHKKAAVAGAKMCWNCGELYTPDELEAGRIKMEKLIEVSNNPINPPSITI